MLKNLVGISLIVLGLISMNSSSYAESPEQVKYHRLLGGTSWHNKNPSQMGISLPRWQEVNTAQGISVEKPFSNNPVEILKNIDTLVIMKYKNSEYGVSDLITVQKNIVEISGIKLGIAGGIVTGYKAMDIAPAGYLYAQSKYLQLTIIPEITGVTPMVVSLQYRIPIDS